MTVLFAALLTYLITPWVGRLGIRLGLADYPGGRRRHKGIIPRTGGIALAVGFLLTVAFIWLLPHLLPDTAWLWFPERNDIYELRRLAALLAGGLFCVVAGLLDDRYEFGNGPQYVVQTVAAIIAITGLIFIKHVNDPFGPGFLWDDVNGLPWWLVWPVTIFWFLFMMNTVNWLDGLSGLVAGVAAIFSLILAGHMLFAAEPAQESVALLPLALLGTTLGFLPFNFAPARIFMGSTGAYFLGYTLAALGIIGGARLATVMLVLGLPALDLVWLVFTRWRRGVSPGQGGRDHLHFRLVDAGIRERTIVIGYWIFCAAFGIVTLLISGMAQKITALVMLGLVGLGVLLWASRSQAINPEGGSEGN
ncbi:MAG: undecaprenyl/decaprenyl-phosphate alpha-N-acetylglucosaminyl 1-phosphate transferase [Caldilineaceae bacterium]|nr:undecaprenyl/decaprenyl-phosphate alpha-N-acetylglucosaminyl 1-phosphate transferase [Caldilineaceae bacterium]